MGLIFNAREVFEIAEQIERNGGKFYRHAAQTVKDEKAKKFLLKLAEMEDVHESFFSLLKEKFSPTEEVAGLPDSENQALAYLQAMAEGKVFGNVEDITSKIAPGSSFVDIINTAIGFEKDTIVFFAAIKDLVPQDLGKNNIDSLIREEVSHIAILLGEKAKI
ncbi:MAG: hypothetical protein A2020_02095 [Lentisphaerae bacterium GWF2_45_14]|nr:MAG: hypothetical protein A2020_02095 [Lentisphaerae bacterium GWF2_45_14]